MGVSRVVDRWRTAVVLALSMVGAASAVQVEVTGSRVNLRTAPVEDAEVAGQVERGARLQARSLEQDWVEIQPPPEIDFWVHGEYLADGVVQADALNVRSGPGIAHQRVGQVRRGDALDVRGRFADWVKIAPPPESSLWISTLYVRRVEPPRPPEPEPTPPPVEPPETVAPEPETAPEPAASPPRELPPPADSLPVTVAARMPPAPTDLRLDADASQGKVTEVRGELARVGFRLRRPSRYRLVRQDGGRPQTVAYIRGDEAPLERLIGRTLHIRGRTYILRAHRRPLVLADQITLFP